MRWVLGWSVRRILAWAILCSPAVGLAAWVVYINLRWGFSFKKKNGPFWPDVAAILTDAFLLVVLLGFVIYGICIAFRWAWEAINEFDE